MLLQCRAGGVGVAILERGNHGPMMLIVVRARLRRGRAPLEAIPLRLVASDIDRLAIVDQHRVMGSADNRQMKARVPFLEFGSTLCGDTVAVGMLDRAQI